MSINEAIKDEVDRDLAQFNATLFRVAKSQFMAQRLYFPAGSTMPKNSFKCPEGTTKVRIFFEKEEDEEAFVAAYPPGSGACTESGGLDLFDKITAHYSIDYADYKQRYWADFHEDDRPACTKDAQAPAQGPYLTIIIPE
jgi:hypothetical protein